MKNFSIQLWSVKDFIEKNGFEKTFSELAKMGYTGVEFAGHGDISAKDMKKYLENANLKAVGAHVGYPVFEKDEWLKPEMEYLSKLGVKYISCPMATVENMDLFNKTIDTLNYAGEILTKNGFVFSYHNHAFELVTKFMGKSALDLLYEKTNPKYVNAQIDVYWVQHADINPYDYLKQYEGRIKILHLKQMESIETKNPSTANNGIIDFSKIIEIGNSIGIKEYVYEDETLHGDQLQNAKVSAMHLLSI